MRRRSGFTLVELLVVIVILLVLATLVFAVFRTGTGSDRMRSSARITQSAFLGAKDRALHAKDLRGVRFIRDVNGPKAANGVPILATGFVYLQPIPNLIYPQGSFQLERLDVNPQDGVADSPDIVILHGYSSGQMDSLQSFHPPLPTVDWDAKSIFFSNPARIRIPAGTGQWYTFTWNTSPLIALGPNSEYLQLTSPFANGPGNPFPNLMAFSCTSSFSSCEIELPAEVMPFHQPVSLPAAVAIDLAASSSNVQIMAGLGLVNPPVAPNIDIMFSSRGMVSGPIGAQGPMHFFLRDLQDAGIPSVYLKVNGQANPTAFSSAYIVGPVPNAVAPPANTAGLSPPVLKDPNVGDRLIVTLFPQTGLVQTFEMDPTDVFDVTTGLAGSDGIADNPFNFAQQGKSAGR